jgi:hypothetical protein
MDSSGSLQGAMVAFKHIAMRSRVLKYRTHFDNLSICKFFKKDPEPWSYIISCKSALK